MTIRLWFCAVVFGLAALPAIADVEIIDSEVIAALDQAKAGKSTSHARARALSLLAWPPSMDLPDPRISAAARWQLVGFGDKGMRALRQQVREAKPRYQADVVATIIEARRNSPSGPTPPDYLPALEEAIWFASPDAKRLAMIEISRYMFPPAVSSTIDAMHLHPELIEISIETLARLRDRRARFFLLQVLEGARPDRRLQAAGALARIGDHAVYALRLAAKSEDPAVRRAAIDALLPVANPDDLTLLHEFVGLRLDEDGELLERIRQRAIELERELEQSYEQEP